MIVARFDALSLAHGGLARKCLEQCHPKEPSRRVRLNRAGLRTLAADPFRIGSRIVPFARQS
jgi:hypothetical protein